MVFLIFFEFDNFFKFRNDQIIGQLDVDWIKYKIGFEILFLSSSADGGVDGSVGRQEVFDIIRVVFGFKEVSKLEFLL